MSPPRLWLAAITLANGAHLLANAVANKRCLAVARHCLLAEPINGNRSRIGRGVMEYRVQSSVGLDAGRPDHLAPSLGFRGDELSEIGGRAR
jgi:hypothetical protein